MTVLWKKKEIPEILSYNMPEKFRVLQIYLEEVSFESQFQPSQEDKPLSPSNFIPETLHRSERVSHPPEWYGFSIEVILEVFLYENGDLMVYPTTYEMAIFDIDSKKWLECNTREILEDINGILWMVQMKFWKEWGYRVH